MALVVSDAQQDDRDEALDHFVARISYARAALVVSHKLLATDALYDIANDTLDDLEKLINDVEAKLADAESQLDAIVAAPFPVVGTTEATSARVSAELLHAARKLASLIEKFEENWMVRDNPSASTT